MSRFGIVLAALAALVCVAAVYPAAAQSPVANSRLALVIGNQTYRDQALATTANDAGLVAQTLQAAGFDTVGARDLDGQSLRTALRDFLDKAAAAGPDMQAFVYLAGRGLQYNGDNYFAPVDAEIRRDADAPIEAVRVSDFVHALATLPGKARIVVLDAARANPYAAQGAPLAPGLGLVDPEPGVLIAFNAAPGTIAGDEQGPYGVFGKTLAGAMRQGGVDIAEVFDQTRILVNQETQGALLPWSASRLEGPYFVFERAADAPPPPVLSAAETADKPIAAFPSGQAYAAALQRDTIAGYREFLVAFPHSDQARRVRAILAARREAAFWRRAVEANAPRAYWTYLRLYSRGPHVADARRRLAILSARFEPPPDFAPMVFDDLPPPPPDEGFYEDEPVYAFGDFGPPPPPPPVYYVYDGGDDWRDLPPPPPPVAVGVLPALEIAIPLFAGAVAYHGYEHRHDGLAPPGVRPLRSSLVVAPPPLPANVRPVAPPPPRPVAFAPATALVKPLPPIGPSPSKRGAQPGATGATPASLSAPAQSSPPAAPIAGKPPVLAPAPVSPAATPQGPAPGGKPVPAAPSNAAIPPSNAPAEKRAPAASPNGARPPANVPAVAPGGKPLPAPPANAANPPPNAPAVAPGGKPLPVPPANAANPPANAPAVAPGGKPLPVPPANAANPPPNAHGVTPGGKPLPANAANPPASPPSAAKPPAPSAETEANKPLQPLAPHKPGAPPAGPKPEVQKPTPQTLAPTAPAARTANEPVPPVHAPAKPAPAPVAHPSAPPPAAALAPAPVHPTAAPAAVHPAARPAPAPVPHPPAQPPAAALAPSAVHPAAAPTAVHSPAQPAPAPFAHPPAPPPAAALAPAQGHPTPPAVHPAASPKHAPQESPKPGQPPG